jgi:Tol biopolymer transport system component
MCAIWLLCVACSNEDERAPGGASPATRQPIIVYRCGEQFANLCRIDPNGRRPVRLTEDGSGLKRGYRSPSLSRDAGKLAFVKGGQAFISRADGSERQRLSSALNADAVDLRPDGLESAIVLKDRSCSPQVGRCFTRSKVVLVDTRDRKSREVAAGVGQLAWFPAERLVVTFPGDAFSVWLLGRDRYRPQRRLAYGGSSGLSDPAMSPRGDMLAVTSVTRELRSSIMVFRVSSRGSGRQLTDGPQDVHPAWSPDGRAIVFSRNGRLYVVNLETKRLRSLAVRGLEPTWGG